MTKLSPPYFLPPSASTLYADLLAQTSAISVGERAPAHAEPSRTELPRKAYALPQRPTAEEPDPELTRSRAALRQRLGQIVRGTSYDSTPSPAPQGR